jgi:hypothetical protein
LVDTWIFAIHGFVNKAVLTVEVTEHEYGGNVYTKLVRMERWSWHVLKWAKYI